MGSSRKRDIWIPVLMMIFYFCIMLAAGIVFSDNVSMGALCGDLVTAAFGVLMYWMDIRKHGRMDSGAHLFRPKMWFYVIAVGVIYLVWLLSQAAGQVIYSAGFTQGYGSYSNMHSNEASVYVATSVLVAPFAEELIFRGFGYRRWKNIMPKAAAALLSSAIFTAYHMSFVHIPVAMTVGLMSCFIYEMTGHIWWNVGFHMLYNMMSAGIMLPVSSDSLLMKPWCAVVYMILVFVFCLWLLIHADKVRAWAETPKLIDRMNDPNADLSMFDHKANKKDGES